MAEEFVIAEGTKEEQYQSIMPQIKALIEGETDEIANLANVAAVLKTQFNYFWVGFYIIRNDELVLGPFQGPVACTRIAKGRGVCGTAWSENKTLIVPDVDAFPGHIACSSFSKSEIVLPYYKGGEIRGVLDIDSDELDQFDHVDAEYLEQILHLLDH